MGFAEHAAFRTKRAVCCVTQKSRRWRNGAASGITCHGSGSASWRTATSRRTVILIRIPNSDLTLLTRGRSLVRECRSQGRDRQIYEWC
jgi:hypothetical protein